MNSSSALNLLLLWMLIQSMRQQSPASALRRRGLYGKSPPRRALPEVTEQFSALNLASIVA
jgi:hypothetical protein